MRYRGINRHLPNMISSLPEVSMRDLSPCETAERSLIKTYRKTLWNPFIAAVKRYELVSPGDHIAVCISPVLCP